MKNFHRPAHPAGHPRRAPRRWLVIALAVAGAVSPPVLYAGRADTEAPGQAPAPALPAAPLVIEPVASGYKVLASYRHDPEAFTEGLLWHNGELYESTGLAGESTLRIVAMPSGRVAKKVELAADLFGEGLALVGHKLVQLTWKSHRGLVYDLDTLRPEAQFHYTTEGWGLTYDGKQLIMSDGSDTLTYLDPETYEPDHELHVTWAGAPLHNINELEFIDGEIWANLWQTDRILRIDPTSGVVKSYLDLTGLLAEKDRTGNEDVLNGIAYDAAQKRIFVTGKRWPRLFALQLTQ